MSVKPSEEDKEELLLSCRYGDLEDIQSFVQKYNPESLADIRDENGNTILHMTCGNGHMDVLNHLLPLLPPSLLATQNEALSTPLHWACINAHLPIVQALVQHKEGPGIDLIDIKNSAGRTPLGEAEIAGWDEGAKWLVGVMNLDDAGGSQEQEGAEEEVVDDAQDIEVEIQDADGQIATMSISRPKNPESPQKPAEQP
ncbi:hypothetical protein JAAARDRAFT_158326 [Jaapia argillacea MUCL 33604]|uniref:Uncharacterized protein n=1 Tax=Jaapia argillacea MUCL 33604 TaxID=933084 RepID=A0A067PR67_9AGAM|nr:hypothetical protein JAAARDRAFT_158326 [Jaapia argillacea MUCL 33604]